MANANDVHDLTSLLDVLQGKIDSDRSNGGDAQSVTVEEVMELIGRRAYGPLLLIIGLISISPATAIPLATSIFATITLLIGVQMLLHKERPWMPKAALRMKLDERKLAKFIKSARPTAGAVDKVIKPRLQFLAKPPGAYLMALVVVLAALATYPLSLIPVAPLAPGLTVVLVGLGLTAKDGLLLGLGAIILLGAVGLLVWRFIA